MVAPDVTVRRFAGGQLGVERATATMTDWNNWTLRVRVGRRLFEVRGFRRPLRVNAFRR
jgi:hypothetical protein